MLTNPKPNLLQIHQTRYLVHGAPETSTLALLGLVFHGEHVFEVGLCLGSLETWKKVSFWTPHQTLSVTNNLTANTRTDQSLSVWQRRWCTADTHNSAQALNYLLFSKRTVCVSTVCVRHSTERARVGSSDLRTQVSEQKQKRTTHLLLQAF